MRPAVAKRHEQLLEFVGSKIAAPRKPPSPLSSSGVLAVNPSRYAPRGDSLAARAIAPQQLAIGSAARALNRRAAGCVEAL